MVAATSSGQIPQSLWMVYSCFSLSAPLGAASNHRRRHVTRRNSAPQAHQGHTPSCTHTPPEVLNSHDLLHQRPFRGSTRNIRRVPRSSLDHPPHSRHLTPALWQIGGASRCAHPSRPRRFARRGSQGQRSGIPAGPRVHRPRLRPRPFAELTQASGPEPAPCFISGCLSPTVETGSGPFVRTRCWGGE